MSTILDKIAKVSGNKNAFLLSDEENPYVVKEWIDTGCYILNAILSDGDIFKGFPSGKRIMISGEASTAKSLFTSYIVAAYLKHFQNAYSVCFESEGASISEMATTVGVDKNKILVLPTSSVEDLKIQGAKILEKVLSLPEKERKNERLIFVVDSLGMMASKKEIEDSLKGSTKTDMTRAKVIRSAFRILSLNLTLANIPMIIVNHTYASTNAFIPEQEESGGGGVKYAADVSLILTKSKDKDENKKQVGISVRVKVKKSRYCKENVFGKVLVSFAKGLNRYSYLTEFAVEHKILKDSDGKFHWDGNSVEHREFMQNISKYMAPESALLKKIAAKIKSEFQFGDTEIEDFGSDDLSDWSKEDLLLKSIEMGIIKKVGYSYVLPDGSKVRAVPFRKEVDKQMSDELADELREKLLESVSTTEEESTDEIVEIDESEEESEDEDMRNDD